MPAYTRKNFGIWTWYYLRLLGCQRAASSVRERTPSLRYTLERFQATVLALSDSARATWSLVCPAQTSVTIRASVSDSWPLLAVRPPMRRSSPRVRSAHRRASSWNAPMPQPELRAAAMMSRATAPGWEIIGRCEALILTMWA